MIAECSSYVNTMQGWVAFMEDHAIQSGNLAVGIGFARQIDKLDCM